MFKEKKIRVKKMIKKVFYYLVKQNYKRKQKNLIINFKFNLNKLNLNFFFLWAASLEAFRVRKTNLYHVKFLLIFCAT